MGTINIDIDTEGARQLLARLGWTVEAMSPQSYKGLIVHKLIDPDGNEVETYAEALQKAIVRERQDIDTLERSLIPDSGSNQTWSTAAPRHVKRSA